MCIQRINNCSVLMAIFLAFVLTPFASYADSKLKAKDAITNSVMTRVVIQVSDDDPKKWNLALNNAQNMQEDLGKDNVVIEIVAYGPGLSMLKLDSEVGGRVEDTLDKGVKVMACQNTMSKQKITQNDMLPNLGYAKSGVVELAQKQLNGYAYIRP